MAGTTLETLENYRNAATQGVRQVMDISTRRPRRLLYRGSPVSANGAQKMGERPIGVPSVCR